MSPDAGVEVELKEAKKPTPIELDKYNSLSQQLFLFCIPFVRQGWRAPITEDTAMRIPARLGVERCSPALERSWQRAKDQAKDVKARGGKGQVSLTRAFVATKKWTILYGVCIATINGFLNSFIRPFLLRHCILWMAESQEDRDTTSGWLLWACLFLSSLAEGWSSTLVMKVCCDEAFVTFAASASRLMCIKSFTASRTEGVLQISGLMGNDVVRSFETARGLGFLPMGVASIIGGVAMLLNTVGVASFAGIATMTSILVLTQRIAIITAKQTKLHLEASGRRLEVLDQIVDSSKAVKFFSWEEPYAKVLADRRAAEVVAAQRFRWWLVVSIQLGRISPIISAATTIICMVLLDMELRAADIFATISVFMALRLALIALPQGYSSLKQCQISFNRIQQYLELPDEPPRHVLPKESLNAVDIVDASIAWPKSSPSAQTSSSERPESVPSQDCSGFVLSGTVRIARGRLVAVVGSVGTGKTTLLSAIVGELQPREGSVFAAESLAYAPQQPQVICGTVRDNILLDRQENTVKLQAAIEAAQLSHDLNMLAKGLDTEIGERGVSLSGGQKQRISLARTIYGIPSDSLLMLDDPIAAVDPMVGRRIFEDVVLAHHARGGTAIVVLNQREYLHYFDEVLSLQDGRIQLQPPPIRLDCDKEVEADRDLVDDAPLSSDKKDDKSLPTTTVDGDALIIKETKRNGTMGAHVILAFIRQMGAQSYGPFAVIIVIGYSCMASADLWLVWWTDKSQEGLSKEANLQNLGVYIALVVAFAVGVLTSSRVAVLGVTRASRTLHEEVIWKLLKAPLSWWDATPKGRITSRFSTDIGLVDTHLGFMLDNLCQISMNLVVLTFIVVLIVPVMVPLVIISFFLFYFVFRLVDITNCEVKRMSHQNVAPLLSNVSECVQMRRVARTLDCQKIFLRRNDRNVDNWNQMNFNTNMLMHFSKLNAVVIASTLSAATSAWLMFINPISHGSAAIAMTYSVLIPYFMGMSTQVLVFTKSLFTGFERLLEYYDLPQEPTWHQEGDPDSTAWPTVGAVEFCNVKMRYRSHLPLALSGVSFKIPGGARAGVIGRTGSGKSTLVACLFRLHEVESGKVLLDGLNVAELGLRCVRQHLTVVPQDPVLMQGSVRKNIDPFGSTEEALLRRAVLRAELASSDMEAGEVLDRQLDSGGSNLSCGERQLLCLARAVISGPRVLIMDEPTSSADADTDNKLQSMVRSEFKCTTICIAHRIRTVADSDVMLVMADGCVLECGSPDELFAREGGEFRVMCDVAGVDVPGSTAEIRVPPPIASIVPDVANTADHNDQDDYESL